MRKSLLVAATAAIVALTGCNKSDVINEVKTPIDFSTKMGKLTKTIIDGTTYPEDGTFGVFAYTLGSGETWAANADISTPLMENVEIGKIGSSWKASTGNYFWPSDATKKTSFFAYSPYLGGAGSPVSFDVTDGITFTDYDNSAGDVDLMVAADELDKNGSTVAASFNHILTQVLFTVKKELGYTDNIEVTSITLNDIIADGTFTSKPAPQWTAGSNVANYIPFTGNQMVDGIATPCGDALVMIPQDVTGLTFTVEYSIDGVPATAKIVDFPSAWGMNEKITYNLTFMDNTVRFFPTVVDWTDVTEDQDID